MSEKRAAIDLGTNTARLLIGEVSPSGTILPLIIKRKIVRLGGGFTREEGLSAEARERALAALAEFSQEMDSHKVKTVRAVATSAVRDAANGKAFVEEVKRKTGISLEIIDGHEEGLLTLAGVHSGLDEKVGDFLVFDIGGGSTEFTLARGKEPLYIKSLPLGVVRLTEGKTSIAAMGEKIRRELAELKRELLQKGLWPRTEEVLLVGTAGTVTTLAAIKLGMVDYDYRKVNNYVLTEGEVRDIYDRLLPLTPEQRLKIPGLEKGREDLIVAGMLISLETMELFQFPHLKVSDFGLLEGVLLSIRNYHK